MRTPTEFEFPAVAEYGLERAAAVLTRAFDDYFVKIAPTASTLLQMVRNDSVDLATSRVVVAEGEAIGAVLIARRGWTARVAGMAFVPEARRRGAGRATMQRVMREAKDRGERAMVLEVIEQNHAAVRLYEECGFARVRRLVGFSRPADPARAEHGGMSDLAEVDPRELARAVTRLGAPDLPWQLSGETLAQFGPSIIAYRANGAWLALSHLETVQPSIRALVCESGSVAAVDSVAILRAVLARFAGKEWRVAAVWPEEESTIFTAVEFVRTPLSQWQMHREL